jgi:HlyD family secretion protein
MLVDIPRPQSKRRRARIWIGVGATAAALLLVAIADNLRPSGPVVERESIVIDSVRSGSLLLEVRATGRLVPERTRWVGAATAGRVERRCVEPGARVEPEMILVEMSNPEVRLEALEAERELGDARAELQDLRTNGLVQGLAQEGLVASATARQEEAHRASLRATELGSRGFLAAADVDRSAIAAREAARQLEIERARLELIQSALQPRLASQEAQVRRLERIVEFHRARLSSLNVRAGAAGIVQEVLAEEGQWLASGTPLARVAQPGRLKAVLRVGEANARDLTVGQRVTIRVGSETVPGHVTHVAPAVQDGAVTVDVSVGESLPAAARPDLTVEGTIELAKLDRVLYVRRPVSARPDRTLDLYRIERDRAARRVPVRLGRLSAEFVEVKSGVREGDVLILSDMSRWASEERIRVR